MNKTYILKAILNTLYRWLYDDAELHRDFVRRVREAERRDKEYDR